MFFKSNNLTARVFERQIRTPRPGTSVNFVRLFYENLVPSYTVYDINCPDNSFRKFTDDGQYLISFSRNYQELIVYRPTWLSFSHKEETSDFHDLPAKEKRFDSYFRQLYSVSLASSNEVICKEFFLYVENLQFGLFATSTTQAQDAPPIQGAIQGIPSIEKITFYLVRLEDGVILDEKAFCNDFVHLAYSTTGVFLYDDLISILSLRYQIIHVLQIRDSGNLVDVRRIGPFCREDDELFLNSQSQFYISPQCIAVDKGKQNIPSSLHVENGVQYQDDLEGDSFYSGIKQRLLSFIYRGIWNEEADNSLRAHCLKKNFYFRFQDYIGLIMWKVQFLDRHHLLIKFGSVDGAVKRISAMCSFILVTRPNISPRFLCGHSVSRNTDIHCAFFAVYDMDTTEVISFYQSSSDELYTLFEEFVDHFHVASRSSLHVNFITSHSNNVHALEQLKCIKSKASSSSQFVKKIMASLPFTCQSQSPSPYFDQSLFRYDEKLISSMDRHRQSFDHPIKFISRRQLNTLKFKIKPGTDSSSADARQKRICSFLFHPFLPFVISIQQIFMQPTVVNFHFRR